MRRRTLLVVGVVVGFAAVVGVVPFIIGVPTTTTDCGLGTGDVTPVEEVNMTVDSPSDARQAFTMSLNDSDDVNVRDMMRANVSAYEHVDLADSFREDIANRADDDLFNESESVYYFTVNGSRNSYSTIGVTKSGTIFAAQYGSC